MSLCPDWVVRSWLGWKLLKTTLEFDWVAPMARGIVSEESGIEKPFYPSSIFNEQWHFRATTCVISFRKSLELKTSFFLYYGLRYFKDSKFYRKHDVSIGAVQRRCLESLRQNEKYETDNALWSADVTYLLARLLPKINTHPAVIGAIDPFFFESRVRQWLM